MTEPQDDVQDDVQEEVATPKKIKVTQTVTTKQAQKRVETLGRPPKPKPVDFYAPPKAKSKRP